MKKNNENFTMGNKFKNNLYKLLKKDARLWDEEKKELNETLLKDLIDKLDEKIIELLLGDKETKEKFFIKIKNVRLPDGQVFVLKQNDLKFFIDENKLDNSYTQYQNKIGLRFGNKLLSERDEVVLDWPFKDCVLEGGMTKEDQKRNEIFFNEVLAKDEIDRLFDPKALVNWKRYTAKGEEKVKEFKRDKDGAIRENLIIKGNNLLALHSLEKQFAGKVKLIYIDPPYYFSDNKDGDSFSYNSNFKLSTWLVFMKNRLEIAKKLLSKDGSLFVQISDDGAAHLKLLLDDVFGVVNFVNVLSVRMKNIAGASGGGEDKKLKKNIEFIYIYSNDASNFKPFNNIYDYKEIYQLVQDYKENEVSWKYTSILYSEGSKKYITSTKDGDGNDIKIYERINPIYKSVSQLSKDEKLSEKEVYYKYIEKIYTTAMPQSSIRLRVLDAIKKNLKDNDLVSIEYIPRSGRNKGKVYEQFYKGDKLRLFSWLKDVSETKNGVIFKKELQGTYWDGFNLNNLSKEGRVQLENGKKPEALLRRILDMATDKNDVVVDYHLGSGTTCAVAHKMGRQYIGIEQLGYGQNDSVVRLKNVIKGDQSGVSSDVEWQGGGDFVYVEIAKWNEEAKERILKAKNFGELEKLFDELYERYFLNYNLEIKKFKESVKEEEFKKLGLDKQKKLFVEMLDMNQMYVNFSERADKKYNLSKEDIALSEEFYNSK